MLNEEFQGIGKVWLTNLHEYMEYKKKLSAIEKQGRAKKFHDAGLSILKKSFP